MIYFYSHYYKNYEFIPNYAINILNEKNEEYNILLIQKDGTIYEQKRKKEIIDKMVEDEVLMDKDPQILNIETIIAKFFLKKGVNYEH